MHAAAQHVQPSTHFKTIIVRGSHAPKARTKSSQLAIPFLHSSRVLFELSAPSLPQSFPCRPKKECSYIYH